MNANEKNGHPSNALFPDTTAAGVDADGRLATVVGVERNREMIQAAHGQAGKTRNTNRNMNRNDGRASQWKVFPMADGPINAGDDLHESPRQGSTMFYRNDTSGFLGELREAESLLRGNGRTASKIDFRPPNRKNPGKTGVSASEADLDSLLSDTDVASLPLQEKPARKSETEDKLIVDVQDFVETFSVMREPVYLKSKKKRRRTLLPEPSEELEHILDGARRKQPIEQPLEAVENVSPPETADACVDAATDINIDIDTDTETVATAAVVETIDEIVIETPVETPIEEPVETVVEELAETVVEIPVEAAVDAGIDANDDVVAPTEEPVAHVAVEKIFDKAFDNVAVDEVVEIAVESKTVVETVDEVADNTIYAKTVPAAIPHILNRFDEFAGDQCDGLAEHIKERVYDGNRLIAFCGMKRGAGCSTMALLAAQGMARHGLKTAVIDVNFEFPQLHAVMTGQTVPAASDSWVDILHGKTGWEPVALSPEDSPMLTVFPLAENSLVNWSRYEPEHLQQETNRLVTTLHEHFDLILLDCGCFDDAYVEITWGELELFQPDGVILVYSPKESDANTLVPCCCEIAGEGLKVFGVAENFV